MGSRIAPYLFRESCKSCDFSIFIPVAGLGGIATFGLYNDGRFAGRSVLALNEHYDAPEDVPYNLHQMYSVAGLVACRAIADVTGARPINFATLCNRVPHVHSHIIPRQLHLEPRPGDPPWNDPREKFEMPPAQLEALQTNIGAALVTRFAEQNILTGMELAR